jgi:predicted dehydrogenase
MTIHVGLIGGGNITETHALAVRGVPGGSIAAIYGTNAETVDRLCREHGGRGYQNFDAFPGHRPMDLVMFGSPSGSHAPHSAVRTCWFRPEGSELNFRLNRALNYLEVNYVHHST